MEMGNSDVITRDYLDSLLIEARYIDVAEPSTEFELFGEKFATPIMTGAMGMLQRVREGGVPEFGEGVLAAGAVHWTGWISDEEVEKIVGYGGKPIRIIKPFEDHDIIYKAIEHDEKTGALGVGMDIDHCFDAKGNYFKGGFGQLGRQSVEDLKGYVKSTKLPFVLKGILSVEDAKKCVEIGVGAIVVSHHKGGYEYAVPPLYVLPEILEVVDGRFPVIVDCGINSGIDAFKALALGADGVLVGRTLMKSFADGPEAVTEKINEMTAELKAMMARTGIVDLAHMHASVIRKRTW